MIDLRTFVALVVTLLLWGSAFPAIRAVMRAYSPGHIALGRFLVASITLAVLSPLIRPRRPERRDLPAFVLLAVIGVAGYHTALNYGLVTVSAGVGSILVNTAPVFTALLAVPLLGERVSAQGWIGLGLSLCGAALIGLGEGRGIRIAPGALLLLLAAVMWAFSIVLQKPLLRRYRVLDVTTYAVWLGTLVLLVFLPGLVAQARTAPLSSTLCLLYLGAFPIGVAYATWAYVLSRLPANRAASLLYLLPGVAIVVGWIWLREAPAPTSLAGGLCAFAGVVIVNAPRHARIEPRRARLGSR